MASEDDTTLDDGLTPEERDALKEEEGEAENTVTDEEQAETPEQKQAEAAAEEQPALPEESAPILVPPPTDDAEAKLTEIASQKETLLTQFDDGDITAKEYQKQLDALNKQERGIELDLREAQLAAKMEQQRLQNEWSNTCNAFVESHAIYKDNPRLYKALDAEVRELAAKPETANWSGQKFLDEAHKNLKQAFGFNEPADKRASTTANLPPNLAKVPAADIEDTNGGRFAVLDRMASSDPLGYEDALSKMSDADRNAYLAS